MGKVNDYLGTGDAVFIVSHVAPVLGLERVFLELHKQLKFRLSVRTIVIGGGPEDENLLERDVLTLGDRLRGWARLSSVSRLFRVRRHLANRTVVIVGAWAAVPALIVLPRSTTIVVWEHSFIRENIAVSRGLSLLAIAAKRLYRRADMVVAVSEPVREDLVRWGIPSVVIENVTDVDEIRRARLGERDPELLCAVGSLTTVKSQRLLLDALTRLPGRYRLAIAGDGPLRGELARHAQSIGVSDRVDLLGQLGRSETLRLISGSAALLHASYGETYGLVFAEAVALDTPVIAVRNRASLEWSKSHPTVHVVDRDPAEVARAIERLMVASRRTSSTSAALARNENAIQAWTGLLESNIRSPGGAT